MIQTILDRGGRLIGRIHEMGDNQKVYMDASNRLVARVIIDSSDKIRTYDAQGRFVGYGDQGMRLLG